jgi:ComEC/Rec2-related protein
MFALSELLSPLLRRPLFCLAILWAGGIVLAVNIPFAWTVWAVLAAVGLAGWLLLTLRGAERGHAATLGLTTLVLSAALAAWRLAPPAPDDPHCLPVGRAVLVGYPTAPPTEEDGRWHAPFRLVARQVGTRWRAAQGDIYLSGRDAPPLSGRMNRVEAFIDTPRPVGNPFGFSWRAYLAEHGFAASGWALATQPLPRAAPISPLYRLRALVSRRLADTMPGSYNTLHARVLEGLVLGIHNAPLPDELTEQFRRAGTIHLMVVSGSQITLLGSLLLYPLWLGSTGRRPTTYPRLRTVLILASLPLLAAYVMLADRGPSVDRAVLMGLLLTVSTLAAFSRLGRIRTFHPDGLTLLGAAAIGILLCNPIALFGPSMQLSFSAVFGLYTLTPLLMRLFRDRMPFVALSLAATLGAEFFTFPVLAWDFGTVPLLGPITNLLSIPLVALLLPLGLFAVVFAVCCPPLAVAINWLNLPLLQALLGISAAAARLPFASVALEVRSPWLVLLYLALLGAGGRWLSRWLHSRQDDWHVPAGREPILW